MSEQKPSNFIKATVREFITSNGKTGWNIDINIADLQRLPVDRYWYVKTTMRQRKEKWKYWDTHFLVENDFVPEKQENKNDINNIPDNWSRNDWLPF